MAGRTLPVSRLSLRLVGRVAGRHSEWGQPAISCGSTSFFLQGESSSFEIVGCILPLRHQLGDGAPLSRAHVSSKVVLTSLPVLLQAAAVLP